MEQKHIYVALLSTPFRVGAFIRLMTGCEYNHGAISLSSEMKYFYSFARKHKSTPFYGCFVKESVLRYEQRGKIAKIKVFAVPVTEEQYAEAQKRIEHLEANAGDYIYNYLSAIFFVLAHGVKVEKAYTCVEFVLSMLKNYSDIPEFKSGDFHSIQDIDRILSPYKFYEGSAAPLLEKGSWEGDSFIVDHGFFHGLLKTLGVFAALCKRYFKKSR